MPIEILYLSAAETRELLDAPTAVALVEQALRWQADGRVVFSDPPVLNLQTREPPSHYRLKGCFLESQGVVGFRVTGFRLGDAGGGSGAPDNTRFVVLSDPRTGQPQAILDEHWTYSVRTVAAAVIAARYLARPDAAVLALVGAGNLAQVALPLLCREFGIREVRVTSRRQESRTSFVARMQAQVDAPIRAVDTVEAAVVGADLVLTCTSANAQLVQADWLVPGTFVCTLGRNELTDAVYQTADKVVLDSWELSQESSDVRGLIARGVLSRDTLHGELSEIVAGRRPGRQHAAERIVARIEGLASQDVLIAHWVVDQARRRQKGTRLWAGE
jgi:alanine dehydrogenase